MSYPGYPPAGGAGYPPAGPGYPPGAPPPQPGFGQPAGYPPPGAGYPPPAGGFPPGGPPADFPFTVPGTGPPQPPGQSYGGPPQMPGFPPAPGYPSQPGGYPQQPPPAGYPPQPGYPQPPPAAGYPQPPPAAGYPGYPQQPPAAGYPQQPPAAGYPQQPPAAGYPQQPPAAGYPGYPQPGSQPPPTQAPPTRPPPPNQPSATANVTSKMAAMSVNEEVGHGTIKAPATHDPETDAQVLRKAMKGLGTDEATIINLLVTRTNVQRQAIRNKFKLLFGKDLINELKSELSGNLEELILGLMEPKELYDAKCLRRAMKWAGTDEQCLIEILSTRSNTEIDQIKEAYKKHFKRNLEKDVVSETSGHFKRLLVSLCQGAREEGAAVDMAKAQREAQELYQAGERRWGTDESKFNQIIAVRSHPQLRATFDEYVKISQRDILNSIEREMSGDLKEGFKAVVMCVRGRASYFAERLYKSMKGAGTDDSTLVRIIVSRSEVDLVEIKKAFLERYHKTLYKMVEGDTSGDYRRLLQAIIGREV